MSNPIALTQNEQKKEKVRQELRYITQSCIDTTVTGEAVPQCVKIASIEYFRLWSFTEVVEASFEIAHMVAKEKKPHNVD